MTLAAEIAVAEVIGEDENDIRRADVASGRMKEREGEQ